MTYKATECAVDGAGGLLGDERIGISFQKRALFYRETSMFVQTLESPREMAMRSKFISQRERERDALLTHKGAS